jgi:condensin complex subunit 3
MFIYRSYQLLTNFPSFFPLWKSDPHKESADQTATNRFLLHSIKYLSRGFEAKNRFVRFRCCQLIAYVVNSLEEIE